MSPHRDGTDGRNDASTTRRAVLRAVGAGAAAGVGLAGAGSAGARVTGPELSAVAARYRSPELARAAVATHAGSAVAGLAARGVLGSASVDQFDFADAEVTPLVTPDGAAAHVSVTTETATHEVEVGVRPDGGAGYATARPTGDGDPITVHADADGVTVYEDVVATGCDGSQCYDGSKCTFRSELQSTTGSLDLGTQACCTCQ